jgi:hypothetical protein
MTVIYDNYYDIIYSIETSLIKFLKITQIYALLFENNIDSFV